MRLKTFAQGLGALALCVTVAVAHAAEPLKIGFIYVGPVGESGWSYSHDVGRKAI